MKNGEAENSVVEAYYQCCADTVPDRALLDMVEQVGAGGGADGGAGGCWGWWGCWLWVLVVGAGGGGGCCVQGGLLWLVLSLGRCLTSPPPLPPVSPAPAPCACTAPTPVPAPSLAPLPPCLLPPAPPCTPLHPPACLQLVYEPCFDTLRTKEQLGYSVHSGVRCTHGVLGLVVGVVSGVHGPAHLDARVEAFLAAFGDTTLASMGEEEFEGQRQALLAHKMMKVCAGGVGGVASAAWRWGERGGAECPLSL